MRTTTKISPRFSTDKVIQDFIKQLPELFDKGGEILHDKRNIIKSYKIDAAGINEVVVKKYKHANVVQRITYSFFKSNKAKRAFLNATELRKRGFSTPHEVAYIEQRKTGFLKDIYYISAADFSPPIKDKLSEDDYDKTMAHDFALFVASMHEKGIIHRDLNNTNVLYRTEGDCYSFSLIDINRMHFYPLGKAIPKKVCLQNLTRFSAFDDMFRYFLRCYIKNRNWDTGGTVYKEGINIKMSHDKQWGARKSFFNKIKNILLNKRLMGNL